MSFNPAKWRDYTPIITLVGGAGNVVPQYVTNSGRYCRFFDICFVQIHLEGPVGNNGAGTGQINISLPVQAGPNQLGDYKVAGHIHQGLDETIAHVQIAPSAATAMLFEQNAAATVTAADGNDQSNPATRGIRISFFYDIGP